MSIRPLISLEFFASVITVAQLLPPVLDSTRCAAAVPYCGCVADIHHFREIDAHGRNRQSPSH